MPVSKEPDRSRARPAAALSRRGSPRGQAAAWLAVAALALAPYARLPSQPLFPDAERAVTRNAAVASGTIAEVLASDYWGMIRGEVTLTGSYRPAVSFTYWLQLRAFGPSPAALHLFDMLLHACGAILVWLMLRGLLPGGPFALGAALLFAVHPAVSEAVCSVVGRADLMAGVSFLGALLLHRSAAVTAGRAWRDVVALVLVGVALLSKEYAATFPFLLIAFDLLGPRRQDTARSRPIAFWATTLLLLGAYLLLRWKVLGTIGSVTMVVAEDTPLAGQALLDRLANAIWLLLPALRLLFVPLALDHVYGVGTLPIASGPSDPLFLAGMSFLLVATTLGARTWRKSADPAPLLALALFALPLLPALNVVGVTVLLFAERFLYLPAAGFVVFVAWALARAARNARSQRIAWIGVAVVVALFAARTAFRVEDWGSNEALARAAVRAHPRSAMAHHELGMMLALRGDFDAAAQHVRVSLDAQDSRPVVWKNYALVLDRLGRREDAVTAWRRAVDGTPAGLAASPEWLRGLAAAEMAAGRSEEAISTLIRARQEHPRNPHFPGLLESAFFDAIETHRAAGRHSEAARLAAQAQELCDLDAERSFRAGTVLARAGEAARAATAFEHAVARDPGLLQRKRAEARALLAGGKPGEAAQILEGLVAARPGDVESRRDLGQVLRAAGREGDATRTSPERR